MRILLAGGSGYVGTLVIPYLKAEHALRVLDLVPPKDPAIEYVQGSVGDIAAVRSALHGIEGVAYMTMPRNTEGNYDVRDLDANYDLHVKHLHRVLLAAAEAGIRRAVYASSMSVYAYRPHGFAEGDDTPPDAADLYGFTKRLGEIVCDYFARAHKMAVVSLRLNNPVSLEDWQQAARAGRLVAQTAAPDVASAIALSLTAPVSGAHAMNIAGDYEGRRVRCARARDLLGWEPLARP
ncbi:MAG: NAD-dependent epimerase/dehydratase family protein [Planctomycetes bacterium]|nr:NAD-dependent epimerase/dehydratase family protein [Planctomycetota bacterium]